MALVTGSLFFNMPNDSHSMFTRPGALFFSISQWTLYKMSETVASFIGRPILTRHKHLAFNRPAAYAVTCVLTDIPIVFIMYSIFELVYYFMVGFSRNDVGNFFTLWFVCFLQTLSVCHLVVPLHWGVVQTFWIGESGFRRHHNDVYGLHPLVFLMMKFRTKATMTAS